MQAQSSEVVMFMRFTDGRIRDAPKPVRVLASYQAHPTCAGMNEQLRIGAWLETQKVVMDRTPRRRKRARCFCRNVRRQNCEQTRIGARRGVRSPVAAYRRSGAHNSVVRAAVDCSCQCVEHNAAASPARHVAY